MSDLALRSLARSTDTDPRRLVVELRRRGEHVAPALLRASLEASVEANEPCDLTRIERVVVLMCALDHPTLPRSARQAAEDACGALTGCWPAECAVRAGGVTLAYALDAAMGRGLERAPFVAWADMGKLLLAVCQAAESPPTRAMCERVSIDGHLACERDEGHDGECQFA